MTVKKIYAECGLCYICSNRNTDNSQKINNKKQIFSPPFAPAVPAFLGLVVVITAIPN